MRNIIVIAYQLHYSSGSEYAVAWDYITHMSKTNRLTVLYGTCRGHHNIGNTDEMQAYYDSHPLENVTLIPVKPSFQSHNYGFSLLGVYRFYKEYKNWHKDVYNEVIKLVQINHYDLIHFLGPIGYYEPGYLYNLPIPYIWGPIGGGLGKMPPFQLIFRQGINTPSIFFCIKSIFERISLYLNKRARLAMEKSDVLICATTEYKQTVERLIGINHHSNVQYLPENCINKLYDLNYKKFQSQNINLLYVGWLVSRKAPFLILESLARLDKKSHIHLDMIGDGPLKKKAQEFVKENDLSEKVTFHGRIDRSEVFKLFTNAHLMVLPSLHDANTTVVWEAMSYCVPTLCLDHCGMHDVISDKSGLKINVANYNEVVEEITIRLNQILVNPDSLVKMAEQLMIDRSRYTWDKRSAIFENYYMLAESNFKLRK